MTSTGWDPTGNPYTLFVRVERGGLWLHEEMWMLLAEVSGSRPAISTPGELLVWLDREAARLSTGHEGPQAEVASVHLAEIGLLRTALLEAIAAGLGAADPDVLQPGARKHRRLH
jgi:hypothetical protein